ncbi:MAG: hypothetical protein ACXWQR_21645 [Ktedonobacterales bacterium]
MKRLLPTVVDVLISVVIAALPFVVITWHIFGIDNTPQKLWVALGVFLVGMVVEFSFRWLSARGYRFSDSDMYQNGTRPRGAFGVGMYLSRKPGGPPEVPFSGPHKFPDGDY